MPTSSDTPDTMRRFGRQNHLDHDVVLDPTVRTDEVTLGQEVTRFYENLVSYVNLFKGKMTLNSQLKTTNVHSQVYLLLRFVLCDHLLLTLFYLVRRDGVEVVRRRQCGTCHT